MSISSAIAFACFWSFATSAGASPLACEIDETRSGSFLSVTARIVGEAGLSVRYDLSLTRTDRAGTALSRQSGAAVIGAEGNATVGSTTVSLQSGASYDATMTVEAAGGATARCGLRASSDTL